MNGCFHVSAFVVKEVTTHNYLRQLADEVSGENGNILVPSLSSSLFDYLYSLLFLLDTILIDLLNYCGEAPYLFTLFFLFLCFKLFCQTGTYYLL